MCVNSLEQTEGDPDVHCENVQVTTEVAVKERTSNRPSTKDHHLSRVGEFSRKTKRRGVLMMKLVDVLVQRAPMECLVGLKRTKVRTIKE